MRSIYFRAITGLFRGDRELLERGPCLPHERLDSLARDGGDRQERAPFPAAVDLQTIEPGGILERVELRADHDLRARVEPVPVSAKLPVDDLHFLDGIASARHGEVHEMEEQASPLDVAQEPVPEPVSFVGPFDEAWDVGDDERPIAARVDDAEVRDERRERIVRDLRPRGRDAGDQGALARVRETDDRDIREELQLEPEREHLALSAFLVPRRRTVRRGREDAIPAPAAPAPRGFEALPGLGEIGQDPDPIFIVDDRPRRDRDLDVRAVAAMLVRAFPVPPAIGRELLPVLKGEERVERGVRHEPHRPACAAAAAVRAAVGNAFLVPKGETAVAAPPAGDGDRCLVDEDHSETQAALARRSGWRRTGLGSGFGGRRGIGRWFVGRMPDDGRRPVLGLERGGVLY